MRLSLGEKIEIREYSSTDVESLVRSANNPRVAALLRSEFPNPYTKKDAHEWIASTQRPDKACNFAIVHDGDGVIGGIGLVGWEPGHKEAELGYWLAESYWGKGIATKAVVAFVPFAFQEFGLHQIFAVVYETNTASARVLEKAGFRFEMILTGNTDRHGRALDELKYVRDRKMEYSSPDGLRGQLSLDRCEDIPVALDEPAVRNEGNFIAFQFDNFLKIHRRKHHMA